MTEQRLRARPSVHKDVSDITSAPHQEISIVDVKSSAPLHEMLQD